MRLLAILTIGVALAGCADTRPGTPSLRLTRPEDYDKALHELDAVIQRDPKNFSAYNDRGNIYKEQKKYGQAISNYDHAIEFNPAYPSPYYNKGSMLLYL